MKRSGSVSLRRGGGRGGAKGRGAHSSTFQLNLSRFRHNTHPGHPLITPDTPDTPP